MTEAQQKEWVDGDYPTDEALARIEQWPHEDAAGCLDFAASIWSDMGSASETLREEESAIVGSGRFLRLATGGWSGNEEIVAALNTNGLVRAFTWRLSASGGLHIYQYPREVPE